MTEYPGGGGSSGNGTVILIAGILGLILGLISMVPNGACNLMGPVAILVGGAGAYLGNQAKNDPATSESDRNNANIGFIMGLIGAIVGTIGTIILVLYGGFCGLYCCCACFAGVGS